MKRIMAYACGIGVLLIGVVGLQAASLRTTINHQVGVEYRGSNDLGSPAFTLSRQPQIVLETGTTTGKADLMFADQRTLAASATETLDLSGSLTDPLGSTVSFTTVKVLKVCAATGNTNNVVVGGAASSTWTGPFSDSTDKLVVKPGGCAMIVAPKTGYTVTNSSADLLLVANSGGTTGVTYDVVVIGTSQ